MSSNSALLTVGSTSFTPLVHAFLSPPSLLALAQLGHSSALAQVGNSNLPTGWELGTTSRHGITVHIVKFTDDLETLVGQAKLVVSHAGAGSILSFMRPASPAPPGRQLVLVPNSTLMDSHQADLADELTARGWASVCTPETLTSTLETLATTDTASAPADDSAKYPPLEPGKLARIVDATLGFA